MGIEIIAEAAQGFEGKPEQAHLLVKAAASAGADAIKFQLVYADELATPEYKYYDLYRSLEMDDDIWAELKTYANSLNIKLYLDVFGLRSLRLAEQLNLTSIKLHGTDIANIGFLKQIATSKVPKIILGAGGAYLSEIKQAIDILNNKNIVILVGFQGYPTPDETNHISRVHFLSKQFSSQKATIGFADHASPENALSHALAATAIGNGALVIEKHLTLWNAAKFEDYESALNPDDFALFCKILRTCSRALGDCKKRDDFGMSQSEQDYRQMIRRHVITSRYIPAGTVLEPSDLNLKRSGEKNALTYLAETYGKIVKRDLLHNSPLTHEDIMGEL